MTNLSLSLASALLFCTTAATIPAFTQAPTTAPNLVSNGDFELDANADQWPDDWGRLKEGGHYEVEAGNRFFRLTSPEAGKTILAYREIKIPAGTRAVELTWKQRVSNLKRGKQSWFDARIMMNWLDDTRNKINPGPPAPNTNRNTEGWVERNVKFMVSPGATMLALMPTLFQVETGTFDLDDIVLRATDAAPLEAAAKAKAEADAAKAAKDVARQNELAEAPNRAKWPAELHVVGTKVLDKNNKEVLLRGVNVDSLQWTWRGERILLNVKTAIDDWKSNTIRLPVKEEYWFGRNAEQKDGGASYRLLIDNAITLAANRGAYLVLDLHRFRAPNRAHVEFWKDAAAKYKDHPAVLFEIFNEPHGTSWQVWRDGGFVEDKNAPADEDAFLSAEEKALNAKGFHAVGMQALIDAVRGAGAKNIIIAGGLDWAYDLSGIAQGFALNDKGGNGIMLATHIYAGKRDWQNKVLVVADKYPIILTEFGAVNKKFTFMPAESQEDAATWVPKIFGFIQKHKMHYTAFSFHPKSAPNLLTDWDYTPTPEWGAFVKRALAGETFPDKGMR
jgi:endoglucanase